MLLLLLAGAYNALTRSIEFDATACFRELGIRSYHYNPLAGGLLTGKYESIDSQLKEAGRFGSASPISGAMYSQRYWKQQIFDAIDIVRQACANEGISMDAAAIRWLLHHSVLCAAHHDGIIFGASAFEHCQRNLSVCLAFDFLIFLLIFHRIISLFSGSVCVRRSSACVDRASVRCCVGTLSICVYRVFPKLRDCARCVEFILAQASIVCAQQCALNCFILLLSLQFHTNCIGVEFIALTALFYTLVFFIFRRHY
jgi:hypothetical protein